MRAGGGRTPAEETGRGSGPPPGEREVWKMDGLMLSKEGNEFTGEGRTNGDDEDVERRRRGGAALITEEQKE